jgi:hypothetical protein
MPHLAYGQQRCILLKSQTDRTVANGSVTTREQSLWSKRKRAREHARNKMRMTRGLRGPGLEFAVLVAWLRNPVRWRINDTSARLT